MQTKNMRLLKASVLCLSVFLLKQTAGHAGLGDEMQDPNFKADRSYYTGVPLMPDQDIEGWSKRIGNLQLDWVLPLDPNQPEDLTKWLIRKLVQQHEAHCNEFIEDLPWALRALSNDDSSLGDFRKTLDAIASDKLSSVKDVSDNDVKEALKGLTSNAPEVSSRLAKLMLKKIAFELSELAKTIKKAPDAQQAGLKQNALAALQESGVLEEDAVQSFADKIRALFQQATASAVPSRETGEDEVREVGDYPLNDQGQLVMSYQQAIGHLRELADLPVSEDVMRHAVEAVQNVLPSLSGDKQEGVQEWIDVIQQGLDDGEYAEDADEAASHFGDVTSLMKVLLIKIFS